MKTKYDIVEHEPPHSPGAAVIVAITVASIFLILCAFGAVVWIGQT